MKTPSAPRILERPYRHRALLGVALAVISAGAAIASPSRTSPNGLNRDRMVTRTIRKPVVSPARHIGIAKARNCPAVSGTVITTLGGEGWVGSTDRRENAYLQARTQLLALDQQDRPMK